MRAIKVFLLLIFINQLCIGQIIMSYTIGCIGGINSNQTSFSGSFLIKGEKCFTLSNGISLFKENKSGLFTNLCEIVPDTIQSGQVKYSIYAYPNPVFSNVTIQSAKRIVSDEVIHLTIYNSIGFRVLEMKTTSKLINEGVKVKMNGFKKGIYFVILRSTKASAELKLIKLN